MSEKEEEVFDDSLADEDPVENLPETIEDVPPALMGSGGIDVDGALQFWKDYLQLTDDLLDDADYQTTSQGKFKKKSAWRKYATAFNISVEMMDEDIKYNELFQVILAKYRVKATLPNKRYSTGVGACSSWEKGHENDKTNNDGTITLCKGPCNGRKHFAHADHDIIGTAFTRAVNRAISDLIGAGEVSAEEMALKDDDGTPSTTKSSNGRRGRRGRRGRKRGASETGTEEEPGTEVPDSDGDAVSGGEDEGDEQPTPEKVTGDVSTDWDEKAKSHRFVSYVLQGVKDAQYSVNNKTMLDAGEYYLKHDGITKEEFEQLKEMAGEPAE